MTEESIAKEKRSRLLNLVRAEITGPNNLAEIEDEDGSTENIPFNPSQYFSAGVLFPMDREFATDDMLFSADDAVQGDALGDEGDQVSILSTIMEPSSMGIEAELHELSHLKEIEVCFGRYEHQKGSWQRVPGKHKISGQDIHAGSQDKPLPGGGYVRVIARPQGKSVRIRVFIVNDIESDGPWSKRSKDCIFQPKITLLAKSLKQGFVNIGISGFKEHDLEERLLEVRFRKHQVFGDGYGCSAMWSEEIEKRCEKVNSDFIPTAVVPQLTFAVDGIEDACTLKNLSYGLREDPETAIESLRKFIAKYEEWINELSTANSDLDPSSEEVMQTLDDCKFCSARMNEGVDLIERDSEVKQSFELANLAMIMQNAHRSDQITPCPKCDDLWEHYRNLEQDFRWRPFQLAFLLLSIEPSINRNSKHRETVDLIWFPTGGGKTEAYLGVAAFTILHRRITSPENGNGTTVLSRYTLRLLTAQQFERTASLVCALEMFRRENIAPLGETPISIGLWLGGDHLPNYFEKAEERMEELLASQNPKKDNPFILYNCPCCDEPLLPETCEEDPNEYGFSTQNGEDLIVRCLASTCPMSSSIPVHLVDEQIYRELPTILIGTIDKFAALAWKEEPGWLISGKAGQFLPPSLIIQDELHLISGPLGTIAGVYETAIEAIGMAHGQRPHLISSTATVRRANEQSMALFTRPVQQFPPSGLDEADSYFAKTDPTAPGRLYAGALCPHTTQMTALVRAHAALLQASERLGQDANDDAYWTLVSYFNNKRELGMATNAVSDDIHARLKVLEPDTKARRKLANNDYEDLHADKGDTSEVQEIFRRLEEKRGSPRCLSLALTTNIISVGVDVDRLGLMLVNGQPRTTAEYIQATSRVGRTSEMPGLVFTLYHNTKPRDRSHYERFLSYHNSIYRYVEPTSLTPFSGPSRLKALHAVMVILVRNLPGGLPDNGQAGQFPVDQTIVQHVRQLIEERVGKAAPDEVQDTLQEFDEKIESWEDWAEEGCLVFNSTVAAATSLLHRDILAPSTKQGWLTMDSMRTIDHDTKVRVYGEPTHSRRSN
jgi:hypothetical protein